MQHDLFRFEQPAAAAAWLAVDDRVMGGVSRSRMRHDPAGYALFEGTLSLDHGGGFASVRADVAMPVGVGALRAWRLDVRGDGRRYKFNLRTHDAFDGVNYQASFHAPAAEWVLVDIATGVFVPTFRGRRVAAPALDPARVCAIGLMLADRHPGPFALALRRISIVGD